MANSQHLGLIKTGVPQWNAWKSNLNRPVGLFTADLQGADLRKQDLQGIDLYLTDLRDADLRGADLRRANMTGVRQGRYLVGDFERGTVRPDSEE